MPNGSRWREGGKFLLAQNIPEAEGMRGERGPGSGRGRRAHAAAITSCGGQLGNETGVGAGSVSKTTPSSFPFVLSVIPPVCLGKAKPVERLQ